MPRSLFTGLPACELKFKKVEAKKKTRTRTTVHQITKSDDLNRQPIICIIMTQYFMQFKLFSRQKFWHDNQLLIE